MDVWDEDGEVSSTAQIEREHSNQGYLDGVTRSKEASLQQGFDDGYGYGALVGLQVGRILGALQALGLSDLEAAAAKELDVARLFSYEYYNKDTSPRFNGEHPLVEKWQNLVKNFQIGSGTSSELKR